MYRVVTNITIDQQSTSDFPNRNKRMIIDFCVGYEVESTWENLTQTAKIELPKNIIIKSPTGEIVSGNRTSVNSNIGGFSSPKPLFLKGDKITISGGYKYFNLQGKEIVDISKFFEGYISKVSSKKPFVLECEDNMWKLKQVATPKRDWRGQTIQQIVETMINGTGFTISKLSEINVTFNVGCITSSGESVARFLENNKSNGFGFTSRFRGNELRVGYPIYNLDEAVEHKFKFQHNIIEDELEYQRRDDVEISALVYNYINDNSGGVNKDGTPKSRKRRIEVLVYYDQNGQRQHIIKSKDKPIPPNKGGERHDFKLITADTAEELIDFGFKELEKYYYTGFRGSFTTFGIPFVKYGDYVTLVDNVLPERNGKYIVKKVEYTGGINGVRQKITLHYKI